MRRSRRSWAAWFLDLESVLISWIIGIKIRVEEEVEAA